MGEPLTSARLDDLLSRLTPEQAYAGKQYFSAVDDEDGAPGLRITTPWPPISLKKGLLLETLLALDEALDELRVTSLDLRLDGLPGKALEEVFATRWFAGVREVVLGKASAKALAALAAGGSAVTLLDLTHIKVGRGVAKLGGLKKLESLRLGFAGLDAAATAKLAAAELPALRRLDLSGWGAHMTASKYNRDVRDGHFVFPIVDRAIAKALFGTELGRRLTHLTIKDVRLDRGACRAFANGDFASLEALFLSESGIADVDALLSNPLPALQHLERTDGFAGAALAGAAFVPGLRTLKLGGTTMTEEDVCATLRRATSLEKLDLSGMSLGVAAAKALVECEPALIELRLAWNALGDQSVALLCRAAFMPTLEVFSVSQNALGGAGIAALAAADLEALRRLGLGGLALTPDEIAPLWDAPWLAGCTGLTLLGNQLDDTVIPHLSRLSPETTVFVDNNRFSDEGVATLRAHFGDRLVSRRQAPHRAVQARPIFDEVFGLTFRSEKRKPYGGRREPKLPQWIQNTGMRVVGTSTRAYVAIQDRDGVDELVALLNWEEQIVPLGVSAVRLGGLDHVPCSQSIGDGPLVVAVTGAGLYAVDVYKGDVTRLGDVGSEVVAVHEVSSPSGMVGTGVVVLHQEPDGAQVLDLYDPTRARAKRRGVTGLAGFRACSSGINGGVVFLGPGFGEEGPIRLFAVDKELGLAAMGGFNAGFTQIPGGIARDEFAWKPADVDAATRRAFQLRDAADGDAA